MIRYGPWNGMRALFHFTRQIQQVQQTSSSSPVSVGLNPVPCGESTEKPRVEQEVLRKSKPATVPQVGNNVYPNKVTEKKSIVAAAFASLKSDKDGPRSGGKRTVTLDDKITSATSVEALLAVAESPVVSRRHALQIVSALADWTVENRVKLSDFEGDRRFVKLCRLLGKGLSQGEDVEGVGGLNDLAMVLGVTGDDEAAKLVGSITLPQMVRVLSSLAQKQRRSIPLLRSLAYNIGRQPDRLDMKQCADLLYALAVLNFPDQVLLEKTCLDLCECVTMNSRPAVVGSVLTSLGMLRYKDTVVLDVLCEWVLSHKDQCRNQDLMSLLLTLAMVNYSPANADQLFKVLLKDITPENAVSPQAWLDAVWSLVILDRATPQHVSSVLVPDFLQKISGTTSPTDKDRSISIGCKLKLLNINAVAQYRMKEYKGPLLPANSNIHSVPLTRSREKQQLVTSILDTFSNFLPSATYLRSDVNTGMGFLLDGECLLDAKCNPLPVTADTKGKRIAIMVWDYRDMLRGVHSEPSGVLALGMQLLESRGYCVLVVPHTEYNPREKLVQRVQYLESQLKAIAKGS